MKIATVCVTHGPCNGGTKHQIFLAKELLKMGHEFHFFLQNHNRPNWINTDGIHYHSIDQLDNTNGDILISNWCVTSDYLKKDSIVRNWKNRILIIHDTATANNKNDCLIGSHYIMGVSPTVLSIATGIYEVHDRVLPLYVHCGASQIFNINNRMADVNNSKIVVGIVGNNGERDVWYRGIDTSKEIISKLKDLNSNIEMFEFIGMNEQDMAIKYKKCHFLFEMPYLAGCPTIIIESMACGTPVVTTYHGTTHLVFNNYNGFVLPKGNVNYCFEYLSDKLNIENYLKMKNNINYDELTWENLANKFIKNIEYIK
jgi:glycosyltransferase involved in cell wall biosynthesis